MTIEISIGVLYYLYMLVAIWITITETQARFKAITTNKEELENNYLSLKEDFREVYVKVGGNEEDSLIDKSFKKATKQLVSVIALIGILYVLIGIFFVKRMAIFGIIKYIYIALGLVMILDGIYSYLYTIKRINNSLEYRDPTLYDKVFDINAIVFYFLTVLLLIINLMLTR